VPRKSPAPDRAAEIATTIVDHFAQVKRDLPWRKSRDPYAIWVSEIMLQQTRVATVIPYWQRWMGRFPSVQSLADAPLDDVLAHWAGLGYYSRARNLHRGARDVVERHGGALPRTAPALRAVPGIGAYTAGAIASIAHGERAPLVDGNVARVLARVFAIEDDVKSTRGQKLLWERAGEVMAALPADRAPGDLNQGLMELGATVCAPRAPACLACPLPASLCRARALGRQDELPVMPKRKGAEELPLLERIALWAERDGEILLARRTPEGLFGGLWELPQGTSATIAAARAGAELLATGDEVADHRQVLSHRRLHLRIVPVQVGALGSPPLGKAGDPGYDAVSWFPLARAIDLGISSATAAVITRFWALDKDSRWTSTPKRSPSSGRATTRSSRGSASSATTSPTRTSPRRRRARRRASTSWSTTARR
jgi:A/G-specific adenine glycosylase